MISQQFKLSIEGMHCASCVTTIEKGLRKIPGVLSASVNLGLGQAAVTAEAGRVEEVKLIKTIQSLGYKADLFSEKAEARPDPYKGESRFWFWRLLLALPFTISLMILMAKKMRGMQVPLWLEASLAAPVYLIAGFPFLRGMVVSLWRRHPDMNALIGIGATAAFFYRTFETAATLLTFLIIGRYLEARVKRAASQSLQSLFGAAKRVAHRFTGNWLEEVEADQLKKGDSILVKPGETIPADGEISEGITNVDESLMTGEPLPVHRSIGDRIFAGSLNQDGSVTVKVGGVAQETYFAQIRKLTEQALANKAPIERLADRLSGVFVPIVLAIAFITFWSWWHLGWEPKLDYAIQFSIAVLIIACPCALGLATPTAVMAGIGKGAKEGILIKGGDVLERVRDLHTIVLDKTGTLTEGRPVVREILLPHSEEESQETLAEKQEEVLRLAAMVEQFSEHLLAKAIVKEAHSKQFRLDPVQDFKTRPGLGAQAKWQETELLIGSGAFLAERDIATTALAGLAEEKRQAGFSVIFVALGQKLMGAIVLEDEIKKTAGGTIEKLKEMEFNVWMISGDQRATVDRVAEELGVSKVLSSMKPSEKATAIAELKKEGLGVAFVGDGFNDALALAAADVGIAFASGSDLSKQASDITLLRNDPKVIVDCLQLARRTYRTIKQNLWLSFIYNVLAIPIAAGALYPFFKLRLTPEIAAIAMSLSSISVVLNSLRLKWQH